MSSQQVLLLRSCLQYCLCRVTVTLLGAACAPAGDSVQVQHSL
jgi:hypothetical protein